MRRRMEEKEIFEDEDKRKMKTASVAKKLCEA